MKTVVFLLGKFTFYCDAVPVSTSFLQSITNCSTDRGEGKPGRIGKYRKGIGANFHSLALPYSLMVHSFLCKVRASAYSELMYKKRDL